MDLYEITQRRLVNQNICQSKCKTPLEVIESMGAIQAQDINMCRWAIGLRLPGSTNRSVEMAFGNHEITRVHALRPTWHIIPVSKLHQIVDLSSQAIKSAMKTMDNHLELNEAIFSKSNKIIEDALSKSGDLSREELIPILNKAGIETTQNRASHLLMRAEAEKIICGSKVSGSKHYYTLFPEKKSPGYSREETCSELAGTYFTSHGPSTLKDFIWWSGLNVKEAKNALENIKDKLVSGMVEGNEYWLKPYSGHEINHKEKVFLLPPFDEFLISYTDRTATLTFKDHLKAVSDNGVFRPIIVVDGKVIGIWKRIIKGKNIIPEYEYFEKPVKSIIKIVDQVFEKYSGFAKN